MSSEAYKIRLFLWYDKKMTLNISKSWNQVLAQFFETQTWKKLSRFVEKEYQSKIIYPKKECIFNALKMTPFHQVKVVILGQDPYHQEHQAHGLAFSVPTEISVPPSLKNIYKEIESDLGITKDFSNGNLKSWTDQGVLLLNSVLTVEKDKPGSHANMGWEEFTDYIIQKISDKQDNIVFLLWGNYAKKKGSIIDRSKHLVLESSHPSPLGAYRGFIGCRHFSQTNSYLRKYNKEEIKW